MKLVDFVEFLIQYAFLLVSVSVHESSHAWTAFKFGDPTAKLQNRVSLNPANHIDILGTVIMPFLIFLWNAPLIGWARPTPVNPQNFENPRRANMFVSGAGPVSNLLSVAFLAVLWHVFFFFRSSVGPVSLLFCYVLATGILVNLLLAVFNLMPVHPLDGSGVLGNLLPQAWAEAYEKMRPYGFIMLLILIYLPFFRESIWKVVNALFYVMGIRWFPLERIW